MKKITVTPGTPDFIGGKVDDVSKVDEKTQSISPSTADLISQIL